MPSLSLLLCAALNNKNTTHVAKSFFIVAVVVDSIKGVQLLDSTISGKIILPLYVHQKASAIDVILYCFVPHCFCDLKIDILVEFAVTQHKKKYKLCAKFK